MAGFALLGLAPQAQDLLVERATAGPVAILVFLALLTFVWAMPTHYAGRILIESDTRYQARIAVCDTCFIQCLSICAPRVSRNSAASGHPLARQLRTATPGSSSMIAPR